MGEPKTQPKAITVKNKKILSKNLNYAKAKFLECKNPLSYSLDSLNHGGVLEFVIN